MSEGEGMNSVGDKSIQADKHCVKRTTGQDF